MTTNDNRRHPLLIVGLVLAMNGLIFLALSWSLPSVYFVGGALGCTAVGIVLATVGHAVTNKAQHKGQKGS